MEKCLRGWTAYIFLLHTEYCLLYLRLRPTYPTRGNIQSTIPRPEVTKLAASPLYSSVMVLLMHCTWRCIDSFAYWLDWGKTCPPLLHSYSCMVSASRRISSFRCVTLMLTRLCLAQCLLQSFLRHYVGRAAFLVALLPQCLPSLHPCNNIWCSHTLR